MLLKNDGALLPLAGGQRLAVIGAFARAPRFQGAGSSRVQPTQVECAFDAISGRMAPMATLAYAAGYDPGGSALAPALIEEARQIAAGADAVALFVGLPDSHESEGFDRQDMRLPAQHERLLEAVCAANGNVAVVLVNGSPVEMPWAGRPRAILDAYLGGQAGGAALADVLFGDVNPSGKLAETFPLAQADVSADPWFPGTGRQVPYREGIYVGYRYYDTAGVAVAFPFGHGLSYTRFDYSELAVAESDGGFEVAVTVRNAGDRAGAEIAQVYVHHGAAVPHRPEQELAAFAKVFLNPGEARRLTFPLAARAFAWRDVSAGGWAAGGGEVEIRVGASSRDIRAATAVQLPGAEAPAPGGVGATAPREGRAGAGTPVAGAGPAPHQAATPPHPDAAHPIQDGQFAAGSFEAWLGRAPPPPEPARPFHLNSTMAELDATWLGRQLHRRFAALFAKRLALDKMDASTRRMFTAMLNDMPLRGLVLQSRGAVSFRAARAMAALADGRPIVALRILLAKQVAFGEGGSR